MKKIIACALILSSALFAVSCGNKAETTDTNAPAGDGPSVSDVPGTGDAPASSEKVTGEDVQFGEPTDSFELPKESEGIVGIWKLGGAEGAAVKGLEIWEFKADGTYNMISTDADGIVSGSAIPGQYRIKGDTLTVIMMGNPIKYTFKLEDGKLLLNDHGSDTILEPYTGKITYTE